jgi:anaerobic selenocysteine-containing dehydrogenase
MRHTTYCRICPATCGLLIDIEEGQPVHVSGDAEHGLTHGFTCAKGRRIVDFHTDPKRFLSSQKRQADGKLADISADSAIEEIAAQLRDIANSYGPDAIGFYSGTQAAYASLTNPFASAWWRTMGSNKTFSSMTVDQSAKWVAEGRLGKWAAGMQRFADADVWLLAGTNPLVSMQGGIFTGFPIHDGFRRLQQEKQRGLKLIVVDPRVTEVAKRADIHLQLKPGTDAALFAGLLHVILDLGLEHREFTTQWADGLEELRTAVSVFTPTVVAAICDVDANELIAAAKMFAAAKRGMATSGTGPDMAAWANVAEHLIQNLNVICGRFPQAGDPLLGGAVLGSGKSPRAEVVGPNRTWETGYRSDSGYGLLQGQLPAVSLVDEIMNPRPDRLRALIVSGGNPAAAIPGQNRIVEALSALDLLVTVDPFPSETAQLANYVIAPVMHLERPDTTRAYEGLFDSSFAQYTPALLPAPDGLIDDWQFFLSLAWTANKSLTIAGREYAPGDSMPTTDEVLASFAARARISLDEVKLHPHGKVFDSAAPVVAAPPSDSAGRFAVMPADVADELQRAYQSGTTATENPRPFHLVVRRAKETMNTFGKRLPGLAPSAQNPCHMHPDDAQQLALEDGVQVCVTSDHGSIISTLKTDPSLKRGVISITHGFGTLPVSAPVHSANDSPNRPYGANVNQLLSMRTDLQNISAMPQMTGVPVTVELIQPLPS